MVGTILNQADCKRVDLVGSVAPRCARAAASTTEVLQRKKIPSRGPADVKDRWRVITDADSSPTDTSWNFDPKSEPGGLSDLLSCPALAPHRTAQASRCHWQ